MREWVEGKSVDAAREEDYCRYCEEDNQWIAGDLIAKDSEECHGKEVLRRYLRFICESSISKREVFYLV